MSPLAQVAGRFGAENVIALEPAQHPVAHAALNSGDLALAERGGGMEPQFSGGAPTDGAVDDTDVEMQMRIQRRAESLDEGDRPEARPRRRKATDTPRNLRLGACTCGTAARNLRLLD